MAEPKNDVLASENPVKRFVVRRQSVDWLLAIGAGAVAYLWWTCNNLTLLDPAGRRSVYQTASAVSTALFGLTMTSISMLMSNLDKPLGGLPGGMTPGLVRGLSRSMFGLMRGSAALLAVGIVLLIVDTQPSNDPLKWPGPVLAGLVLLVGARMLRVTYLLSRVLTARRTGKK